MDRILPSDSALDRMLSYHLADRIRFGAVFHLVMVAFFAFGTEAGLKHRTASIFFYDLARPNRSCQVVVGRSRLRYGDQPPVPTNTSRRMLGFYILHTMSWSLYTAYVFYSCFGDLIAEAIMVICVAGSTSAATNSLSASRFLSNYFIVTQLSIVMAWSVWAQDHFGPVISVVMVVYLLFQLERFQTKRRLRFIVCRELLVEELTLVSSCPLADARSSGTLLRMLAEQGA